jgi:hypothetical protein
MQEAEGRTRRPPGVSLLRLTGRLLSFDPSAP